NSAMRSDRAAEVFICCVRRYKGCAAFPPRKGVNSAVEMRVPTVHNLITDLAGVRVAHAHIPGSATGVTAVFFDTANVASAVTRGGGPGVRDTALLEPEMT